jgi:hypothetical protein
MKNVGVRESVYHFSPTSDLLGVKCISQGNFPVEAKSSILVGGLNWLNEYMSFVIEQEDLVESYLCQKRERTTTHCVAHKSSRLLVDQKKKKKTNKYLSNI